MHRLTKRQAFTIGGVIYAKCENCHNKLPECCEEDRCSVPIEALSKLAAYEDAEEAGLLIRLPCKVGDTVYTVDLDCRDNPDQSKMCFCWNKSCKDCDKAYLRVWENHTKTADVRSIVSEMGLCGEKGGFGKTVFLTRAEAEAALALEGEANV